MGHLMPHRGQERLSLLEHVEKYVDVMDIGSLRTAHDLLLPELRDNEKVLNSIKCFSYTSLEKDLPLFQDDIDRLTSVLIKIKAKIKEK